jgi:hypothetical protein
MRVRFWDGNTREVEKSVKLSLGDFFEVHQHLPRAPSTPKPGHIALSPHRVGGRAAEQHFHTPTTGEIETCENTPHDLQDPKN